MGCGGLAFAMSYVAQTFFRYVIADQASGYSGRQPQILGFVHQFAAMALAVNGFIDFARGSLKAGSALIGFAWVTCSG